jgi:hypothetical protein
MGKLRFLQMKMIADASNLTARAILNYQSLMQQDLFLECIHPFP